MKAPLLWSSMVLLALAGCTASSREVRGREDALRDIAAGKAQVLGFGLPRFEIGNLDPETGLPRGNMGCVIEESRASYADAYNAEIQRALKDGRLTGRTLAHKVTTRAAVEKRFAATQPGTLVLDGAAIDAPGGTYRVNLKPRKIGRTDDDPTPYLYVTDLKTGSEAELMFVGGEKATVLFDHDGTTLLVRDDGYSTYMTFDLPSGLFMQGFPDRR